MRMFELKRLYKILKKQKLGWAVSLDDDVLNIVPLAIIAEVKGMLEVSFVTDALPLGVARIIQTLEREKFRYDLYEYFKFDDSGELIWESQDKKFWDEKPDKRKNEARRPASSTENNLMYR